MAHDERVARVTRRGWLVIGLVGVLAFLGGVGLFRLLVGDEGGPSDQLAASGSPTAEPTPSLTDEPSPTPQPTSTPRATLTTAPTPAATHTPKPTPSRTASPTPRPTTTSPTPKPTTKSPTPKPTPTCTPGNGQICIENSTFTPPTMTVSVGAHVRVTNLDGFLHTWTSSAGQAVSWDSGDLSQGGSYSFQFSTAGTYTYICRHHGQMHGTITVQ